MDVRIISLGTLPEHPLRDKARRPRTGHATTTLVRAGDAAILVDPGLPPAAVVARLDERAGLEASDITHVFLTSFKADTCRGLRAFDNAEWLIHQAEREAVGVPLATLLRDAGDADDETRAPMSYTVLARRYRSQDLRRVVGQEAIAKTLRNAIESDRVAHAYLFCGTRGVGKTSMARIFAKALNGGEIPRRSPRS
jgi:glyoxylase-like metal-dependent hydrolase (beta-lactamase superfamily II)